MIASCCIHLSTNFKILFFLISEQYSLNGKYAKFYPVMNIDSYNNSLSRHAHFSNFPINIMRVNDHNLLGLKSCYTDKNPSLVPLSGQESGRTDHRPKGRSYYYYFINWCCRKVCRLWLPASWGATSYTIYANAEPVSAPFPFFSPASSSDCWTAGFDLCPPFKQRILIC